MRIVFIQTMSDLKIGLNKKGLKIIKQPLQLFLFKMRLQQWTYIAGVICLAACYGNVMILSDISVRY